MRRYGGGLPSGDLAHPRNVSVDADDVMFVSVFGERVEDHRSLTYRITSTATGGALYQGFRRYLGEVARTARRVV